MLKNQTYASYLEFLFLTFLVVAVSLVFTDMAFAATPAAGSSGAGTALASINTAFRDLLAGTGGQIIITAGVASAAVAGGMFKGGGGFNLSAALGAAGVAALIGYGINVFQSIGGVAALI